MSWGRTATRTDRPAHVTVIDLIARPGSTCTGFVSELTPTDAPHVVEHTCEESFLKMMFPDHRTTRELEKITQPLRTLVKRLGVAPLVPGRHGRVIAEHTLRVVPGTAVHEPSGQADPPATDEEFVVKRNLWVFPRVDRLGSVLTNKAAAFSISVPNADSATAGELLFINMNALCGIRPRAIKLSIRRTMRCRLNAHATRAALSPFRKALLPSTSTASASPRTIISRSTARYNALSTRAHTLPPGVTIPSVTAQHSAPTQLRQTPSSSEGALTGATTRHASLPVIVAASELSDNGSRGSRNGRRSGAETQQTVDFVATVQRVIIGKPFGHSFDGCFYIRIPQTCFSVKTELVDVQHHLTVSLRFGMGRSLKKQVAVHIHQMQSGGEGPLHVSTSPPGGWQPAFDLAGGRATSTSECPICFECMHGSHRSSMESRRSSVDWTPTAGRPLSEVMHEAPPSAQPDMSSTSGAPAGDCAEAPCIDRSCGGACGGSSDGGVSCASCSRSMCADGPAPGADGGEDAGGKVMPGDMAMACAAHGAGGALMAQHPCSDTVSDLVTSDDQESDVDEAVVRNCSSMESSDDVEIGGESDAAASAASAPSLRLPACMSSPVPLSSLDVDAAVPAAAASGTAVEFSQGSGNAWAGAAASAVPQWLKEDLAVTDCGHVFHSVCLLRHEHAVAARAGTSTPSPQCPVCRQVYRRYLGAMGAAHN